MRFLKTTLFLAVLAIAGNFILEARGTNWAGLYARFFPCQKPTSYTIGTLDSRFGLSEQGFLENILQAEQIWEAPLGRELFSFQPDGENVLEINLIYDDRQEATSQIKQIEQAENRTRASYDVFRAEYESLERAYQGEKRAYEARVASFEVRQAEYGKQVNYWNNQGGAPEEEYNKLNQESDELEKEFSAIKIIERGLNEKAGELNELAHGINALARELNLNVAVLNTISQGRGEEFTQGEYISDGRTAEINIYEFSTKEKLVRVLAHELGHALGLGHVEDEGAIMYRLNENTTGRLSSGDTLALEEHCRIN